MPARVELAHERRGRVVPLSTPGEDQGLDVRRCVVGSLARPAVEVLDANVEVADRAEGIGEVGEAVAKRSRLPRPVGVAGRTAAPNEGGAWRRGSAAGRRSRPGRGWQALARAAAGPGAHMALRPATPNGSPASIPAGAAPSESMRGASADSLGGRIGRGAGRFGLRRLRARLPSGDGSGSSASGSISVVAASRHAHGSSEPRPACARCGTRRVLGSLCGARLEDLLRVDRAGDPRQALGPLPAAVGRQHPRPPVVGEHRPDDLVDLESRVRVVDGHERLDPAVEVAVHEVRRSRCTTPGRRRS